MTELSILKARLRYAQNELERTRETRNVIIKHQGYMTLSQEAAHTRDCEVAYDLVKEIKQEITEHERLQVHNKSKSE